MAFNQTGAVIGGTPKFSPGVMFNNNGANAASKVISPALTPAPTPSPAPAQAIHPGMLPSSPVKKVTTDANGNKNETHYAGPEGSTPTTGTNPGFISPTTSGVVAGPGHEKDPNNPNGVRAIGSGVDTSATAPENNTPAPLPPPIQPTFPGIIGGAVSSAQGNAGIGQSAKDIAAKYSGQISQEQQNLAGQLGNIDTSGTTLQTALGREGVLNRTSIAKQQALGTQMNSELAGTGQQISAQGQQTSGLLGAAGLTPEALRYGGAAGGTLNPLQNLDSIAQQVISGQLSPSQAEAMGGGISTWPGALNQALIAKDPNYNKGVYEAKFGSTAAGAGANVADTQSIQGAQNNIDSITSLIKNGNLNPSKINLANEGIQAIQKNLSNSDYNTLLNALGTIDAALTKVTGAPVDIATLSSTQGTSLLATINNQVALAKGIAAGKIKSGSTPNTRTMGSTSGTSFTEGQKNSTGDLVYKGGKWVKS